MLYTEYIPQKGLHGYVEKIWYCKASDLTATHLTIPLLHHELVFNFSASYKVIKNGEKHLAIDNLATWVNGIQGKGYLSLASGQHEMLGVLFKPDGLKAFLKYSSCGFSEKFISGDLIFGNPIHSLASQLQETPDLPDKIALIEKFLISRLTEHRPPAYLPYSIKYLSDASGAKGNINLLCKELSISNKSLIQAFKKHIGICPAKFARLKAINNAILRLSKNPSQSFTQLAYELNFYDQSHFINLFKKVTGLTPSEYCHHVHNKAVDRAAPNFVCLKG